MNSNINQNNEYYKMFKKYNLKLFFKKIQKVKSGVAGAVLLLLFQYSGYSQNKIVSDSLLYILETATTDSAKAAIYSQLCWEHRSDSFSVAFSYGSMALEYYKRTKNVCAQCQIYNTIGVACRNSGNYNEALEYYFTILKMTQSGNCNLERAYAYNNIGNIYLLLEKYSLAHDYVDKALAINKMINNESGIAYNIVLRALIFSEQKNWVDALQSHLLGLDIRIRHGNDSRVVASYMYIGDVYMALHQYDSALVYYNKGKELNNKLGYFDNENLYRVYGSYYTAINNYDSAKYNLNKYIEVAKNKYNIYVQNAYDSLSKVYFEINDFRNAYIFQNKARVLQDSLRISDNTRKITQLEMQYEFEQKEKIRKIEVQNQKSIFWAVTFSFIVLLLAMLLVGFFILRNLKFSRRTNHLLQKVNSELVESKYAIESQNEVLRTLNNTKDKFFSIIAHDLRGPISGFKEFIELIVTDFDLTDTENLKQILEIINKNAGATYDLLENLLMWARSQRNEISFKPEQVNLFSVSETSILILKELAAKKQISLINSIPKDLLVTGDSNMLSTVFRNLLSNAIKFTTEKKNIYLNALVEQNKITISIKDEGVGIKPEDLEMIFNSNEHFVTKGTAGEKGSGLGLMLCKEFVEKHAGKIWVESNYEKGSDFKFTIPLDNSTKS